MMENVINQDPKHQNIVDLVKSGDTPSFYINGFSVGYSVTEMHLILNEHSKEKCIIQLSFPVAKSLMNSISGAINDYEEKTGASIQSLEELQSSIFKK